MPGGDDMGHGPVRAGSPAGSGGATGDRLAGDYASQQKQALLDRIERDFTYHAPAGRDDVDAYQRIRSMGGAFAKLLVYELPIGRELSTALTKIEEAVMHANAGRARGGGS